LQCIAVNGSPRVGRQIALGQGHHDRHGQAAQLVQQPQFDSQLLRVDHDAHDTRRGTAGGRLQEIQRDSFVAALRLHGDDPRQVDDLDLSVAHPCMAHRAFDGGPGEVDGTFPRTCQVDQQRGLAGVRPADQRDRHPLRTLGNRPQARWRVVTLGTAHCASPWPGAAGNTRIRRASSRRNASR
jgi:hypothetical protein